MGLFYPLQVLLFFFFDQLKQYQKNNLRSEKSRKWNKYKESNKLKKIKQTKWSKPENQTNTENQTNPSNHSNLKNHPNPIKPKIIQTHLNQENHQNTFKPRKLNQNTGHKTMTTNHHSPLYHHTKKKIRYWIGSPYLCPKKKTKREKGEREREREGEKSYGKSEKEWERKENKLNYIKMILFI